MKRRRVSTERELKPHYDPFLLKSQRQPLNIIRLIKMRTYYQVFS